MKNWPLIFLVAVISFSCGTLKPTPSATTDDTALSNYSILFVFEDIPSSFWLRPTKETLFVDFFIYNIGRRFDSTNIKSFRITNEASTYWDIKPDMTRIWMGGWVRLKSEDFSIDGSVQSLGRYVIEIETTDGTLYRRIFTPSDVDSDQAKAYIFSKDYKGKIDGTYLKSLSRPEIISAAKKDETVSIEVSENDNRVKSMRAEFYNSKGEYVGDSPDLVNLWSEQSDPALNGGAALRVDGTFNDIELPSDSIRFKPGKTFADVSKVGLLVFDGKMPEALILHDAVLLISQSEKTNLKDTN